MALSGCADQEWSGKWSQELEQVLRVWNSLDAGRRVLVIATAVAVLVGVVALGRFASQPSMSLLYSGLEPAAAGDVISALEASGVMYEVRGNSVYVDNVGRDQLRLSLAAQGLPANGAQGYELLDGLSGFGTTSQMFDAAYLRAKEGELARTILANASIKAARVHIAQTASSPFRANNNATASVSIRAAVGQVPSETANSIRYLVASAVAGLSHENVSVIDADRGVLLEATNDRDFSATAADRAAQLKRNVERLIEARTGLGNAIVEVNVETLPEDEVIIERRFSPDERVAISSETTERNSTSTGSSGSGVTVASNLPDGDAGGTGGENSAQDNETREVINYEVSETTREVHRVAGSIKRISVAVLVDGVKRVDDAGSEVWEPRAGDELTALEALVKSAVGFEEQRGDVVTIQSMDLAERVPVDANGEAGWVSGRPFDFTSLAKVGITALVVLILGLFVLRPLMRAQTSGADGELLLDDSVPLDFPMPDAPMFNDALSGEIQDNMMAMPDNLGMAGGNDDFLPSDPVERLKALIEERQDETIAVLKSWIEDTDEVVK